MNMTNLNIQMVGLDAAGKTTILYKLKLGKKKKQILSLHLKLIHF